MNLSAYQDELDWIASQQQAMLNATSELALINSGTLNVDGIDRVGERLLQYCAPLEAEQKRIDLPPLEEIDERGELRNRPVGRAIRLRKNPQAERQILLCGHLDTVFSPEDPFQNLNWLNANRLGGPGVTDMKGGLVIMIHALMALERSVYARELGWTVIFNPDEEVGSPCSDILITEAAHQAQLGLVFEPALPDGSFAGERKGSGNFTLVMRGRAAHAGRDIGSGRNAVRALCDFISALDNLNGQREGVTINPARFHGGGPLNQVPDLAVARFNVRTRKREDEHWIQQQLNLLSAKINERNGLSLHIHGGFTRPPKQLTPAAHELSALLAECGSALDIPVRWTATGGCCDGNNIAAQGIPVIDTLGAEGGGIHSSEEFLIVDSLSRRAQLTALLLFSLARGQLDYQLWPQLNR
ncbi:hydrolase [Marinobacterium mangrovicola]|uniref:Glutamate carboxypeptidase n=1 Tax=Marinobacterium mangrovicola TaxID=1476959 RepID=A0A4V2PEB8_9GAMM|nr:hydrolase [Marinobacterium mangrovicola]TCK08406.1 glutamate carboxypeptidase [Marinobacterium mangrovicola]